ncbi:MAG: GGDEF domain-containing protein [Butyrivibrio sp.]|nr:GGDEF domain-containing protein [Butyrivibrio sp.]
MRLKNGAKMLVDLYKDYRTMDKEELACFYQEKCDYYQNYVEISLIAGAVASLMYIYSDYLLNGTIWPTLIPRLSILAVLVVYYIGTILAKKSRTFVLLDCMVAHGIVLATIWAIYHLDIRTHASEGFIIMNLVFLTVGFVARPRETSMSILLFWAEILLSYSFNRYENLDIIFSLEIPCGLAVIASHIFLTLFYLDHYRMQQKLEKAMITDPLTQVYNRHLLEKIIAENALTDVRGPVTIAMLDIDHFKKINDEHGHYTGDLTLLYIGQKLSKETHDDDYVIRYGGEEFVIILKNCDVNSACARMEQFRQDIENATDTPVPFTISIGISKYDGDYNKSIQNVDNALYKAKNSGRNRVIVI